MPMIPFILKITKSPAFKVLVVAAVVILIWHSCDRRPSAPAGILPDTIPVVQTRVDNNGKLLAVIRSQELKIQENGRLIDSLAAALKVKPEKIKTVDRYIQRIDTVIRTKVVYQRYLDSVVIAKKDGYIDLVAVGRNSGISSISLKHTDTLWRTEVRRTPLFKAPYTEVIMRSSSPYNSIHRGNSFQVKQRKPFVTVGPILCWDIRSQSYTVGLGVQFPLLLFYR